MIKNTVKRQLKKLVSFPPVPCMSTDNVYALMDALYHKRGVEGAVVEVGCANGGTTAYARRFLSRLGPQRPYVCVDTFSGFVQEHLETDHALGLTADHDDRFSANSVEAFSENLRRWGVRDGVTIVQGDISKVTPDQLPQPIAVCLLDVDLRDPIYDGLQTLVPLLAPGGVVLVDDCKAGTSWVGADVGYRDYVTEKGLPPRYYMGFGVVEAEGAPEHALPWAYSDAPIAVPEGALL